MMKTILCAILFLMCFSAENYSQTFDTKYSAEYVLKDKSGTVISRMNHYRNGDKLKFVKVSNKGKADEMTTEVFIFKNEGKVYTLYTSKNVKMGNRHAIDLSFVGMLTGVYIFDLGNDGAIFNSNTRVGPEMVNGRECIRYNLVPRDAPPGGITDYYFYQDNLMLKRVVGSVEENNSIEASSYDAGADVPESMFTLPAGVEFPDY